MTDPQSNHASDRWVWGLVATASAAVLVLAIVQGRRSPASARIEPRPAPHVTLPLLGGGTSPLPSDRVTLVDFWATWCAPCRASMPRVQRLFTEYKPKGLELYSVDTDDPGPNREDVVREFLLQHRLTFPVVLDDSSASEAFRIASLPTMVLLDRQGRVVWHHIGGLDGSVERELRERLDGALAQP